ncbi:MAG: hypothetical protein ACI841_005423 [Planctomycetota bacterium]|jgi:hypothetical protein
MMLKVETLEFLRGVQVSDSNAKHGPRGGLIIGIECVYRRAIRKVQA